MSPPDVSLDLDLDLLYMYLRGADGVWTYPRQAAPGTEAALLYAGCAQLEQQGRATRHAYPDGAVFFRPVAIMEDTHASHA